MKKISIIIPNYNGEKYILDCLKSINNNIKDYSEIEAIIVDDCSTDSSINIIENYSDNMKLKLIKLINNKGVSNARNVGIENSTGEYIFFLDSDDYLLDNAIDRLLYYTEKNYDIVFFDFETIGDKKTKKNKEIKKRYKIKNNYNEDLYKMFLYSYKLNHVWGQLIKTSIAKQLQFDISAIMAEDFKFNLNLFFRSNNILITDEKILFYRNNDESITNTKDAKKILKKAIDSVNCYYELCKYDKEKKYTKKIKKRINDEFIMCVFGLFYSEEDEFENYYLYCKSNFNKEVIAFNLDICNYKWIIKRLNKEKLIYNLKKKIKKVLRV